MDGCGRRHWTVIIWDMMRSGTVRARYGRNYIPSFGAKSIPDTMRMSGCCSAGGGIVRALRLWVWAVVMHSLRWRGQS